MKQIVKMLLVGIVTLVVATAKADEANNQVYNPVVKQIQLVIKDHFIAISNATRAWWFVDTLTNMGDTDISEFNQRVDVIMSCMPDFKDLNETTKKVYTMMTNSSWAVYQGMTNHGWLFQTFRGGGPPVVIIIPEKLNGKALCVDEIYGPSFACFKEKKVVFMPGINGSKTLLAALYYDEFSHLLQSTNMDKDLAEAESHTLSIQVIVYSKPEYAKKIQEIVGRRKFSSFEEALASVTVEDLQDMDNIIIKAGYSNKYLSLVMMFQHLLAVGFAYEDRFGTGDPAHKAEIYRFVSRL